MARLDAGEKPAVQDVDDLDDVQKAVVVGHLTTRVLVELYGVLVGVLAGGLLILAMTNKNSQFDQH